MEIKQKECFIPTHCKVWGLQPVAKYARMAAEFVNLYSKWRGINRFPAMLKVFDLLDEWDKVRERGFKSPEVPNLRRWVETESKLGNPALEAYCREHSETDEADMHRALRWSKAVNAAVADIVTNVPPFPYVRESLEKAKKVADVLVCSATPQEALIREWEEHGISKYYSAAAVLFIVDPDQIPEDVKRRFLETQIDHAEGMLSVFRFCDRISTVSSEDLEELAKAMLRELKAIGQRYVQEEVADEDAESFRVKIYAEALTNLTKKREWPVLKEPPKVM